MEERNIGWEGCTQEQRNERGTDRKGATKKQGRRREAKRNREVRRKKKKEGGKRKEKGKQGWVDDRNDVQMDVSC